MVSKIKDFKEERCPELPGFKVVRTLSQKEGSNQGFIHLLIVQVRGLKGKAASSPQCSIFPNRMALGEGQVNESRLQMVVIWRTISLPGEPQTECSSCCFMDLRPRRREKRKD